MRTRVAVKGLVLSCLLSVQVAPTVAEDGEDTKSFSTFVGPDFKDVISLRSASSPRVSPDGSAVLYTLREADWEANRFDTEIWVARSGEEPFQLTRTKENSSSDAAWSPDGKQVAFLADRGDDAQIWLISARGGEARPLTAVEDGVSGFQWSPDGSHIAFLMADPRTEEEEAAVREKRDAWVVDENLKNVHLYVTRVDPTEGEDPRRLTNGDYSIGASFGGGAGFDWSPDGSSIVFGHVPRPKVDDWTESDLSVVDVATGAVRPLVETGAAESGARYSPDGRWIAFTASDDPPTWAFTRRVHVVPAEGGFRSGNPSP